VVFIDDQRLFYVAGNNIVDMKIDEKTQKINASKIFSSTP
jgi:hypothetical protein